MVRDVMGDAKGESLLEEVQGCIVASRQTVSVDRPDLSYPAEREPRTWPAFLRLLYSRGYAQTNSGRRCPFS